MTEYMIKIAIAAAIAVMGWVSKETYNNGKELVGVHARLDTIQKDLDEIKTVLKERNDG